jgi:hypothetical protein
MLHGNCALFLNMGHSFYPSYTRLLTLKLTNLYSTAFRNCYNIPEGINLQYNGTVNKE